MARPADHGSRFTNNDQRSTNAKFIDIDNVLFHNSHIMPYASQRYSEDAIISNRAALGDAAFVGFSRTLNGQAPGRESQFRMRDPVLLIEENRFPAGRGKSTMKRLIILIILFLGGISLGQSNKTVVTSRAKPIQFDGKVTRVVTQIKDSTDVLQSMIVHLDMKIINKGEQTLIFPTKDFDCRTVILKTSNGKFMATFHLPTAAELPKWKTIVKTFDKEMPPESKTTLLEKGTELGFNTFFKLDISTNEDDFLLSQSIPIEELKKGSSILMEVVCTTKPKGLDINSIKENGDDFWQGLQKRWSKYGYLWLDNIVSEPVLLDLSSAVVKAKSAGAVGRKVKKKEVRHRHSSKKGMVSITAISRNQG